MSDDSQSPSQKSWLEKIGDALLREPKDREQLVKLLRDAQQRDLIEVDALKMIEGVLQVSSMRVRDIMISRSQMVVVEKDATLEEILPIIIESGHSRFPVIGENRDEIVGILLAKDLLPYQFNVNQKTFHIADFMRPPEFIPESKRCDVLLREFRLNHKHMALVVDEYGGIAGLITIEDVLEEIVGEIEDEYDIEEEENIKETQFGDHYVRALTPIDEFNEYFSIKLSDEEYDTIGGLVMNAFGYLPKRGDKIDIGKVHFKVLQADDRRVGLLKVKIKK